MTIHLLRDYFTQNVVNTNHQYTFSYVLSIFLRRVLGYSHVGNTNYNINSVGTLLIATGDSTPTGTPTFSAGTKAGINLGSQKEYYVSIPASVRVVSGVDVGRVLVLRSTANPRHNSGIFNIVGIETSTNSYVIDYRTLGDPPPVEAPDSIQWWLYERDSSAPTVGANNTKTSNEYRSDGDSTTPRIILQSPHVLGWQVRICNETASDQATNCPAISVSPGLGGNASGDFATFGQHFHAPMWYNSSSSLYYGGAPGLGGPTTGVLQWRVTICGDDTGQGVIMYCRRQGNATGPNSNILCFGLPENETSPLPINNHARLFSIGSGYTGNSGNRSNDGGLQVGLVDQNNPSNTAGFSQGMGASPFGTPVSANASMWAFVSSGAQGSGIQSDGFATDNPYTSSTDVLPIDIVQGAMGNWYTIAGQPYPFAPRIIGTIPHIRQGRSNFGDFSPTTDFARSYQHLRRGLYIPWNGPNMIP